MLCGDYPGGLLSACRSRGWIEVQIGMIKSWALAASSPDSLSFVISHVSCRLVCDWGQSISVFASFTATLLPDTWPRCNFWLGSACQLKSAFKCVPNTAENLTAVVCSEWHARSEAWQNKKKWKKRKCIFFYHKKCSTHKLTQTQAMKTEMSNIRCTCHAKKYED